MNTRSVDKTKRSNIKCEHCKHFDTEHKMEVFVLNHLENRDTCALTGESKQYWNRCKGFEWADKYKENDNESSN